MDIWICFPCFPDNTTFPPLLFKERTCQPQWHFPSQWGHQVPEWYEITGEWHSTWCNVAIETHHSVPTGLIWWIFCQVTSANAISEQPNHSQEQVLAREKQLPYALLRTFSFAEQRWLYVPICCPKKTFIKFAVVGWALTSWKTRKISQLPTVCKFPRPMLHQWTPAV